MPASRVLYIAMTVAAVLALAGSAFLVFTYNAPGDGTAAVSPTPLPDASPGSPTSSIPVDGQPTDGRGTPPPDPSPTSDPSAALVKVTQPASVEPDELTGYVWPVRKGLISSRFQVREAGFVIIDGREYHDGLDLTTRCGDRVRAAHDGTVLYAGRNFDPYFGYWGDPTPIYARLERLGRVNDQPIVVVIDDGNGYRSVYVHLQRAIAEAGQIVKAGDVIGLQGQTGFATGCHLHYGLIRMDGVWQDVVPRLAQFGYPPFVRQRINPIHILPWDDQYAPQVLQDKAAASASPGTSPTDLPSDSPSPQPSDVPSATPAPSPAPAPTPIPL